MTEKNITSRNRGKNPLTAIWRFYIDGFRSMTLGRYLWAIILIKIAIVFLVFKLFFFPDILEQNYDTDAERAQAVRNSLVNPQ